MRPITTLSYVAILTLTSLSFTFNCHNPERKVNSAAKGFALVELFTSEGCSSCPPADAVMAKLSEDFPDNVYLLGYHVDYWNYIGWKDEFSNPAYTERQRSYAEAFGLNSIYTPQMVINGRKELVGSKESLVVAAIQEELRDSSIYSVQIDAKKSGESIVTVNCRANIGERASVCIALVQLKAASSVQKGENKGRKLNHVNIVRDFRNIAAGNPTEQVSLNIPAGLSVNEVKVIAFLQDNSTMNIIAATEALIRE